MTEASQVSAAELRERLRALADPEIARGSQRFFKTGPGEYGEGDRFLGVRVPALRHLARGARRLPIADVESLLHSPWHEERLLALLIMVDQAGRADEKQLKGLANLYLKNLRFINNWDLVDSSAEHVLGRYFTPDDLTRLEELAASRSVWERRVAVMSTFRWIKNGVFSPTLRLAESLLRDEHDLIHKAVGWMIREIGKRDRPAADAFLVRHSRDMPRTMLRYAIERYPEAERQRYLSGTI